MKIRAKFLLAGIALGLNCPPAGSAEYEACPRWQITVVDKDGKPVSNCPVYQQWAYYFGASYTEKESETVTDKNGRADLPRRVVTAFVKDKIGRQAGALNPHSSYGPSASVDLEKRGFERRILHYQTPDAILVSNVLQSKVVLVRDAVFDAVMQADIEKLKAGLSKDPNHASGRIGTRLLNDVVRSPKSNGPLGVEMSKTVVAYLVTPDLKNSYLDDALAEDDLLSPLARAAQLGRTEVAEYLLSVGANPNRRKWTDDSCPTTALHLAVTNGNVRLVKSLLAHQADPLAKDKRGKTPLALATKAGNQEIIELLTEAVEAEAQKRRAR